MRDIQNSPASESEPQVPQNPKLVGLMPGALMYRVEPSHGVTSSEADTTRQLRCLAQSPAFAAVPEAEREILIQSIARTAERVEYHYQRFRSQRQMLDEIRAWAPGDVFWDAAVSCMHYELQAMAGAARVIVDELLFLTARRYRPTLSAQEERSWAGATVFRDPVVPGSLTDVPEVHRLCRHRKWFDLLNAYRNMFFHRGWQHGSGHFNEDGRRAAQLPKMNALLVPDQRSLTSRSRPYDWTWHDRTTVDEVASRIHAGLVTLLKEVCTEDWDTGVPQPGTLPDDELPNLIVTLPVPVMLTIGDTAVVPIFSSREKALVMAQRVPDLSRRTDAGAHELIEVRSNADVVGSEAISLSFAGLLPSADVKSLHVCLDPEPTHNDWKRITAAAAAECLLAELIADDLKIVSLPVQSPMIVYMWRTPFLAI